MLYKQWPSIRDADVVIVDGVDPIPVLGAIDRVRSNSSNPISFHEKRVYVVSEIRANLLGKLLASSVKPL
ncbi:MAG TPA: hypothetical protein PK765_01060 [bacterium]|nr:hypothetical protein [bacterium]